MELSIRQDVDAVRWGELVADSSYGNLFHGLPWIATLTDSFSTFEKRFVIVEDGDRYLGGFPFVLLKRVPFLYACFSQPFGTYGGPILRHDAPEDVLHMLAGGINGIAASFACTSFQIFCFDQPLELVTRFARVLPLFRQRAETTHLIDLTRGFDYLWTNMYEKDLRNVVRQAERKGISFSERTDTEGARILSRLYSKQAGRAGWHEAYHPAFFSKIVSRLGDGVKIWIAEQAEEHHAAILALYHEKMVMPWVSGATEESRRLKAFIALLSHVIADACGGGYRVFNFGGSGEKNRLIEFKETFGARPFLYPTLLYHSRGWRAVRSVKRIFDRGRGS